jgi:ferredoxin
MYIGPDEELEKIKAIARTLLSEGYAGIIGLKNQFGNVGPYFFKTTDEINSMVLLPKYLLSKYVIQILSRYPSLKIGLVARECDVRALHEIHTKYNINLNNVYIIGLVCDYELAQECNCIQPSAPVAQIDSMKCRGCGACVDACIFKAIELRDDTTGMKKASVNKFACKGCGICAGMCCNRAVILADMDFF